MKNPLIRKGMTVTVLGLGISGSAAVRYLHGCGAKVHVSDARKLEELTDDEKKLIADCCSGFEGGGHTETFLEKAEMIFLSPGISRDIEPLKRAKQLNIPVFGELALAAPLLQPKVVAITGTNGKTTVTTLIGELLEKSKKSVFVGGNIGRPILEYLMADDNVDVMVVEISSFQLELAGSFKPDIAVLLNITPDHLDRHGSLADYIGAKANIFKNQDRDDRAIISGDDQLCKQLGENVDESETLLFGHGTECHARICESVIFVRWKSGLEEYNLADTAFDNHIGRLNSAASILVLRALGCEKKAIEKGLAEFKPLPHRMQIVEEIDGVTYCNDSKATNTGAVISALEQIEKNVILIAGGRDKGDDYGLLKSSVQSKVKKLVLIGEAADAIAEKLEDIVEITTAASMKEAVHIAKNSALPGDTVLLSPACASFDMFESYGHRGESFIEAVRNIVPEQQTSCG